MQLNHLSDCIDPNHLSLHKSVLTPNGDRVKYHEWIQDPQRVLSIRERKANIIRNVRSKVGKQAETEIHSTQSWNDTEDEAKTKYRILCRVLCCRRW